LRVKKSQGLTRAGGPSNDGQQSLVLSNPIPCPSQTWLDGALKGFRQATIGDNEKMAAVKNLKPFVMVFCQYP
jgi:hypothetical protein